MLKIAISSDHGGYSLKEYLVKNLKDEYNIVDFGCNSLDSVDYPIYASYTANAIKNKEVDFGIVICTNGVGVTIVANKFKGVRCALCINCDMAEHAKLHNDANCLSLGAKNQSEEEALNIAKAFLTTSFSNEERHLRRVNEIIKLEENK